MKQLLSKLQQVIALLLSKPLDSSTSAGRSQERYRRAAWTTLVMMAARVSNILTGLLTVPMTLRYLGEDLFGIWMVLIGFVGILSFYDFGIGVGLRNMLIQCAARDDFELPSKLIGNALLILSILAFALIGVVYVVFPYLPWSELIKCKDPASAPQIMPAAQAATLMFAVGLPIVQLQNIANAYQRGYWGYLCFLVGRIFAFLFVVWCVKSAQPLWVLAGGYVGIPFLLTLGGWLVLIARAPFLRPWPIRPDLELVRTLFGIGFYVLIHHLSFAMINTCGLMLIANTINAASGVPYSITQQMVGVSTFFTGAMMLGVSTAVGEAWHRHDYRWVSKTLRRTEMAVLLSGIAPLSLLLFVGQRIILWWTQSPAAVPSFPLLLACVLLSSASSVGSIYSNCLMAMNYVRFIALTKFVAGLVVIVAGYAVGVASQSPALIGFLQFSVGALIPAAMFRHKMKDLLLNCERVPGEIVLPAQVSSRY